VDEKIMEKAIEQLRNDINIERKDHALMARCENIEKAEEVYNRYYNTQDLREFNPILIHSYIPQKEKKLLLNKLKS
jgi:hypothetical protein